MVFGGSFDIGLAVSFLVQVQGVSLTCLFLGTSSEICMLISIMGELFDTFMVGIMSLLWAVQGIGCSVSRFGGFDGMLCPTTTSMSGGGSSKSIPSLTYDRPRTKEDQWSSWSWSTSRYRYIHIHI